MSKRVAVVVGVNTYALPDSALRYAVADAEAVATRLQQPPYDYDVRLFKDHDANRRNIVRTVTSLGQEDLETLIFYFAGHGAATSTGTYLLSSDAEFLEDGIEVGALARMLDAQKLPGASVLAILDACHSGAAGPRGIEGRGMTTDDLTRSVSQFASSATRAFLAACLPQQSSWEDPEVGHGLFTAYLLEALDGAASNDGTVTVASTYQYISKPFLADTRQLPVLRGDLYGDLVIGTGLPDNPKAAIPPMAEANSIITKGRNLLDSYMTLAGTSREEWLKTGYAERIRCLEPIILWFDKEVGRNESLMQIEEFSDLYSSAWSEAGHLGHLAPGLNAPIGRIDNLLGEGTFGSVWKVEKDGAPYAVKVYHPTEIRNHEKLTRFRQGYQAMRGLSHQRIVKVQDFSPCPVAFSMTWIDGPNLKEFGAPEDASDVVALLLDVSAALRHAHALGVIHRDVKPENIIMQYDAESARYEPFVTDFDLAWFSTATQLTNQAIGALSYAAPEQLAARLPDSARLPTVDIYSFGQLAYFAVLNSHPTPLDYQGNQRRLDAGLRSKWGDSEAGRTFSELYVKCNAEKPEDRIQTVQECIDYLIQISDYLQSVSRNDVISADRLVSGIAYALSGSTDHSFSSSSGRTAVEIRQRESPGRVSARLNLEIRFRPLQQFGQVGKKMSSRRSEVNRQIDDALRSFAWASRRSGNDPGFEIFLDLRGLELRHRSILDCRNAIDRVIEVMER